jgi:circadian clock protein KaiB
VTKKRFNDQSKAFERTKNRTALKQKYVLCLYVTGASARSARAILNLKALCDAHLPNRYTLQVVDVYQQPERAREADILASPTLIKHLPPPVRRFIGDLSDHKQILLGLDVQPD